MRWSDVLCKQLGDLALDWAKSSGAAHYCSLGDPPTILFSRAADDSAHGNFHTASWKAIMRNPSWHARTRKPHTRRNALPDPWRDTGLEMDSCNSSDALLMNCFAYPGALPSIAKHLVLSLPTEEPEFGFAPDSGNAPAYSHGSCAVTGSTEPLTARESRRKAIVQPLSAA